MLKVCVGQSEDVDAIDAINEVIESCNQELKGLIPQAGILFCAIDFDFQVILDEINRAYPDIELIGCTTDGEIGTSLGFVEDSITLMLFYSDTVEFKVGVGRGLSKDIPNVVKEVYDEARKKCTKEPRVCITTPESLTANAVVVLEQLKSLLGEALPIIGGFSNT